ncbi:polyprenol monophosphomannose synthase [Patescibacteria group bacterium]|nr:polyprenol monophosphomannose synthase [Patescibacteria group bacterium]
MYTETVIIIPTYNELGNIEKLVKLIFKVDTDIRILFVDDKSPDGTGNLIKKLQKKNPNIYLLEGEKKGLGVAYKRGFSYAIEKMRATYIIQMDADLSHNPKYIKTLTDNIKNFDVIIGSRYIKGGSIPKDWGFHRRMISNFGNILTRLILNIPMRDCTSGFKIIKTKNLPLKFIKSIDSNGYLFQVELLYFLYKSNCKIKEIPIDFRDRTKGTSKMRINDILEYFTNLFKIRKKYQ